MDSKRIFFTGRDEAKLTFAKSAGSPETIGTLTGYAIVWGTLSSDRGGYKVRLQPDSATFATPTHALYHHDYRYVIGNTQNGTLRITPDLYGVKVEIDLPDTTAGRDVATLVGGGYVDGMSFAMLPNPKAETIEENGETIFEVSSFTADEVTVTPIPAFSDTSISVKDFSKNTEERTAHALKLEAYKLALRTLS
jgi:HK97 family phage prohead protease